MTALVVGRFINALGTGFVLPFLPIYLVDVKHFPLALAGAGTSSANLAGLFVTPLAGELVHRWGAPRLAVGSLATSALLYAALPFANSWVSFLLICGSGMSIALLRPAQQTLTATAVAAKRRHRSFAWTYLGVNTGLGAGGLAAAALITARPSYLDAIILVNALSYALAAAAFAVIRPTARAPASAQRGAARSWRSYRRTLSAPGLKTTLGLHLVWYLGAMSGFTVGVPVYLLAVTTHTALAGLLFGTNTITVILLQVPAASFVEGRQRAAMLQVCFALPAFAWCALGVVGLWPAGWVPTVTLLVAAIVIGTAECLYSPIVEPLIADSVHPEEIGRAYAALTVSRQVGSVLGPILVSGVLAAINNIGWLVLGGGSLVAAAAAHRLRHRLPDAIARTPQTSS